MINLNQQPYPECSCRKESVALIKLNDMKILACLTLSVILNCGLSAQVNKPLTKADAQVFTKSEPEYVQVQKELQQLEQQKKELLTLLASYNEQLKKTVIKVEKLEKGYDGMGAANNSNPKQQNGLLDATRQMQETQMSFNLQYLQLQSQMQHENRSYTAISNIMKTKHDTVKNSISNIR